MQFAENQALDEAIKSTHRTIRARVTVDWNGDGSISEPLEVLDPWITTVDTDRSLKGSAPEELLLVEGNSAAELTLTMGGEFDGMPLVAVFSRYNKASPLYGKRTVGAQLTYLLIIETAFGDVSIRQFIGEVRTIQPDRASGTVTLTALDRVEVLRKPVIMSKWAMHDQSIRWGEIDSQVCWSHSVIDNALRQCDVGPGPKRPTTRQEMGVPDASYDGVQFFLSGNGSYIPTIGWMDHPQWSSFPNRGKAMYEANAQVHPSVVNDPDAQPLLGLNGVGGSNYGGGWPASYDREGYLRFWAANRDEIPWNGSAYMGLTLNDAQQARNFSLGNGVEILQIVGNASRIYRIMMNNGQIWATRRIFRGLSGPNDEVNDGQTAPVNIPNVTGPVDVFVQWDNTSQTGSRCHVRVGGNTNGFPNVGSPVTWEYYQAPNNILGRVSVGNVVDMSDIFVSWRNLFGSAEGATWHAWRKPYYAAVLDRGLNRLSHIPVKRPIEAWRLITDIAAAEFGAVFWDENGIFRFWNQDRIQEKQNRIVRRVTLDHLDRLNMTDTLDSVRNVIAIEAKKARALYRPSIYSSSDIGEFETPADSVKRFTVWSDSVIAPNASRASRYQGTQGTVAGPPIYNENSHGYVIQGYFTGGQYGTGWYEENNAINPVYAYTYFNRDGSLSVTIDNRVSSGTNNRPIRFAKGVWDKADDDSPAFNVGGTALVEYPAQTFIVRNSQSIQRYGEKTLELSGDWYHDTFSANNMISTLMRRTAAPIPVTDDINIPGDPRLQLGDTIAIDDEAGYGIDILAQIIGIRRSWSSRGLTDTLTLEVTQPSEGDRLPDVPPGVTVERINLCRNPRLMNNADDWFSGNRITAFGFPGADHAYQSSGQVIMPRATVEGGKTYTMSVWCIPGFTGYITLSVDWYEDDQFWGSAGQKRIFVTDGELTRLAMSVTAPTTVQQAPLIARFTGGSAQFSQVLYEEGPNIFDYFDGSSHPPNTWWHNDVIGNEISYWHVQGDEESESEGEPGGGGDESGYQLRRNLCNNPAAGANTNEWFYPTETMTQERVTTHAGERSTAIKFTGTPPTNGGVTMPIFQDVQEGDTYICSVEIQNDGTGMLEGSLQLHFKTAEGGWIGSGGNIEFFIAPQMRSRIATVPVAAPAGAEIMNGFIYNTTEPYTATAGMYEQSGFNDYYFDGDSASTSETTYSWEGTQHNSISRAETGDAPGSGDAPSNTVGSAALAQSWGVPSHWDEFNYIGQPDPLQWSVYGNGGTQPHPITGEDEKQCWPGHGDPGNGRRCVEQVSLDGEKMQIAILPNGDQGAVSHRFNQQYGKWEVRARVRPETNSTGYPGHAVLIIWPESNEWPEHGEYDFFECDITQKGTNAPNTELTSFIHYPHPDSVEVQQEIVTHDVPVDLTEWHNYAVEWTPDGVYGYFDGELWFSHEDGYIAGQRSNIQDMPSGHLTMQVDNFNENHTGMQQGYLEVEWIKIYPLVPVDEESPSEPESESEPGVEVPTETRYNLCPNPCLKTNSADWYGPTGAQRISSLTGMPRSTGWRAASHATSSNPGPNGEVTAGLPHTFSAYVKPNFTGTVQLYIDFRDSAFEWMSGGSSQNVSVTNGVVQRVSRTFTPPTGAAFALMGYRFSSGDYMDITGVLYEQTDTVKDYFDGDSPYGSWDSGTDGTSTLTPPDTGSGVAPDGWQFFIDTSHYQEGIDLEEVHSRGYAGNIVKIGQGASTSQGFGATLDDQFQTLVSQSLALWPNTTAGYWYLGDSESAAAQASRCAAALGTEYENLPVMLDWEVGGGDWSNFLAVLNAFRAEGINVTMMYCSQTYANSNGVSNVPSTGLNLIHSRFWYDPEIHPADPPRVQWDDIVANASGGSSWGFATIGGKLTDAHQFTANGSVYSGMPIDVSAFPGTAQELSDMMQGN